MRGKLEGIVDRTIVDGPGSALPLRSEVEPLEDELVVAADRVANGNRFYATHNTVLLKEADDLLRAFELARVITQPVDHAFILKLTAMLADPILCGREFTRFVAVHGSGRNHRRSTAGFGRRGVAERAVL